MSNKQDRKSFLLNAQGQVIDGDSGKILTPQQAALKHLDRSITQLQQQAMMLIEQGADPTGMEFANAAVQGASVAIQKVSDVLLEAALEISTKPVTQFDEAKQRVLEGTKRMRVALEEIAAAKCTLCAPTATIGLGATADNDDQQDLPFP